MNKDNYSLYPPLPPQLEKKWQITDVLKSSVYSQVYIINPYSSPAELDISDNKKILKIVNERIFNKNIYKKIKLANSPFLQLPLEIIRYKHNYYMINEYNINLTKLISTNGINIYDILNIAADISCSLKTLHSHKILHLDCTPSNIYLGNNGSYCLGDFSSAIFFNSKRKYIITTPGYTPPEIIQGKIPDTTSDIYIYSNLLFTLFNNGYTSDYNNPDGNIKDNIPEELYYTILKGCSINPGERFYSFDEINNILESKEVQDKIYNYNYNLYITDFQHPLYYLKTSIINSKTCSVQKNKLHTHFGYIALIAITCVIFIFCVSNYIYKTNKHLHITTTRNINNTSVFTESRELDISGTGISSIPNPQNADFSCSKLTILYADVNKIVNLDNLIYYNSLNELYLSDNLISNISALETLYNLKILVLSYNDITDLSPVASLTTLKCLDLSGNYNLKNISKLTALYNLKTLNLTNTNITKKEIGLLSSSLPGCEIFY